MEEEKTWKIVVIGPESTGKSTLCQQLAEHYHTCWCPEYAREYLLKHGMNYTYDDLLTIARGQIELEETVESLALSNSKLTTNDSRLPTPGSELPAPNSSLRSPLSALFIDTDMYVMKVWCEFVFGKVHPFVLEEINKRKYDLYLLCNVDLPWVKDELREYPDLATREKLYLIYRDIMVHQPVPWMDISGNYDQRLEKAISAVDALLT